MSKKNKLHKKDGGSKGPEKINSSDSIPAKLSLIVFDRKVNLFLLLMIGSYFVMSFSKIHTSSVANWDRMFGIQKSESVLAGKPRPIRQDEWMLNTPALAGQYKSGFPVSSPTLGDGNVPVIFGFPIKDFSMVLRPNLWPYFVLDIERAFAFSWNFISFFFIISSFLFFMLLTRNNFWLSLAGAFFIFLGGAMQWWSYWLGVNMIYLNGIIIGLAYLLYSKNTKALVASGLIVTICCYSFLVNLYPPWQVPMAYLYLFILTGFILKKKDYQAILEKSRLRISILSITGIVLLFFVYHYYDLIKETSALMMNTAYPGKRSTNGGDLTSGKLFSEFFGMYLSDAHVPKQWLNICEASGFIMFFPIVFYGIVTNYVKSKKPDWQLLFLSAYVLFLLIWVLLGFPSLLSKLSLLSMSPVYRTLPVLGVANCILLICYLGNKDPEQPARFSWLELAVLATAIFIFVRMVAGHINDSTSGFFKPEQISIVTVLMTAAYLLVRYKDMKYTQPVLALILFGMTVSNIKIHPLTSGLSSLLKNPLVKATEEISRKDPAARWAVFGNQHLSNLLKVNGMNVFNGVKMVPLLKEMAVLDPTGENNFTYNRYAHINMLYLIDMKDSIQFKLNENKVVNDNYTIFMDPCSPRLQQLGITYFLFTYAPEPIEIRCMTPVKDTLGLFIYRKNEL